VNDGPADPVQRLSRSGVLPPAAAGLRLDQAVAALWPDHSRSRLAAWLRSGALRVDGRAVRPRDVARGGERVALDAELEPQVSAAPQAIALDVLYEDRDVFVLNKPPGLVVHPGAGNAGGTLQNALLHRDPALAQVPRAGIVHRLDKDTSGALVVARTLSAHTRLVEALAARDVHRQYEAVVEGSIVAGGTIDLPLDRHPHDRLRRAVVEGGRPAVTHYRVRERFRAHTLLQVELETGRTHQIRVHLAHQRHAIVGDPLYGHGVKLPRGAAPALVATLRAFRRQALHAERLEFPHPRTNRPLAVAAPRPADLEALVAALRDDAHGA
jgi:23S rRNA pseudouridine1911/1915/1917 synthase